MFIVTFIATSATTLEKKDIYFGLIAKKLCLQPSNNKGADQSAHPPSRISTQSDQ